MGSTARGLQFLDRDGNILSQSDTDWFGSPRKKKVIVLKEGERIVGFKGRSYDDYDAQYYDIQFVIGRMQ